ncbi:MAG: ParA family protein [Pseudomonadota bacterium]|nr:ParA family protein [Pseudomonadota bacterium]
MSTQTKTIAIVSQKGGVGKTTHAIHLAAAAELQGEIALIIDADPQASACEWSSWRDGAPPEVIDSAPARIAAKVELASQQGASFITIDTPPHSDSTAAAAVEVSDLVLIPCRPSAFDLAAMRTSLRLVELFNREAWVLLTAGPPNAPRICEDARELVREIGGRVCPITLPERAIHRHASADGRTVCEVEPAGKAAQEVSQLYNWTCEQLNMSTSKNVEMLA